VRCIHAVVARRCVLLAPGAGCAAASCAWLSQQGIPKAHLFFVQGFIPAEMRAFMRAFNPGDHLCINKQSRPIEHDPLRPPAVYALIATTSGAGVFVCFPCWAAAAACGPGPGPSCPGCRGCRCRCCGFGLLTAPLSALALALRVARLGAARRCIRHCRLPAHGTRAWPIITRWFRHVLLHLDRTARRPCRLIPWPGLGGMLCAGVRSGVGVLMEDGS